MRFKSTVVTALLLLTTVAHPALSLWGVFIVPDPPFPTCPARVEMEATSNFACVVDGQLYTSTGYPLTTRDIAPSTLTTHCVYHRFESIEPGPYIVHFDSESRTVCIVPHVDDPPDVIVLLLLGNELFSGDFETGDTSQWTAVGGD